MRYKWILPPPTAGFSNVTVTVTLPAVSATVGASAESVKFADCCAEGGETHYGQKRTASAAYWPGYSSGFHLRSACTDGPSRPQLTGLPTTYSRRAPVVDTHKHAPLTVTSSPSRLHPASAPRCGRYRWRCSNRPRRRRPRPPRRWRPRADRRGPSCTARSDSPCSPRARCPGRRCEDHVALVHRARHDQVRELGSGLAAFRGRPQLRAHRRDVRHVKRLADGRLDAQKRRGRVPRRELLREHEVVG